MSEHPSHKLPNDKRIRLFQVSSGEFVSFGFKQASLNRIISEVGMSKSSFYHYFANKEDLFRQTLEYVLKPVLDLHETIDLETLTAENLWPTIMGMAEGATALVNSSPDMIMAGRMFYRCYDDPGGHYLAEEILGEFSNWATNFLKKGQDLGVFRTDLPVSLLIDMLMAVGMSMERWMLKNWESISEEERLDVSQSGFGLFVTLLEPQKS